MIHVIPRDSLGHFRNDWLDSRFHFSFAGVTAPMGHGFGPLRVWNDDRIQPAQGFDMHGHRDMEIVTYVRRGAISHRDNLGNSGRTAAGDVQVMHAGTGIMHAEYNLEDEETELFQIWVEPNARGLAPGWREAAFPKADRAGRLVALASGRAEVADALAIHQDATLYGAYLEAGDTVHHPLGPERIAYLVAAAGAITVDDQTAEARDGVAVWGAESIAIAARTASEVILLDLPSPAA